MPPAPATIPCPFCAEEIRAEARRCRFCRATVSGAPVVIEQTSKHLKIHLLASSACVVVAVLLVTVGGALASPAAAVAGVVLFVGGGAWYAVTRMRIWWHHG